MMRRFLSAFGSLMLVVFVLVSCDSHTRSTAPVTVIHEFVDGLGGWQTPDIEKTEVVRDQETTYLRLHKTTNKYDGRIWKIVSLKQYAAKRVSLVVVAKSITPSAPLSVSITCQTGKQDGPTYGVLAADSKEFRLSSDWNTYKMTVDIPEGTREFQFGVGIERLDGGEASVDISSIEYVTAE